MSSVPTVADFIFSRNFTNSTNSITMEEEALLQADNLNYENATVSPIGDASTFAEFVENELNHLIKEDLFEELFGVLNNTNESANETHFGNLPKDLFEMLDNSTETDNRTLFAKPTNSTMPAEETVTISGIDLYIAFVIFVVLLMVCGHVYRYLSSKCCAEETEEIMSLPEVVAQYRARYPQIDEEDEDEENTNIELLPICDSPSKRGSQARGPSRRNNDYVPITCDFDEIQRDEQPRDEQPRTIDMATQTFSSEIQGTESEDITPEQLNKLIEECKENE